jgi:hypothetical protein
MKNIFYILIFILFTSACNSLKPLNSFENSLSEASYQKWTMGARGGDRGIIFRVKFYELGQELKSDTLWVNSIPMETEVTNVGDTTYVSAFYTTNVTYKPTLVLDTAYAGLLNIYLIDKRYRMTIKSFARTPEAIYP